MKALFVVLAIMFAASNVSAATITINVPTAAEADLADAVDYFVSGRCDDQGENCTHTKAQWVKEAVRKHLKKYYIRYKNKMAEEAALDALTPVTEDDIDLD
jgi:biopolymer transport protein ExbD